jgi:hypothetical protein
MKPLENVHLLGRERYSYPERNMDVLGNCASRVGNLFLDTCACTPTCELTDEEKGYIEKTLNKSKYRNWNPKECTRYVVELLKEIDRNENIVTTRGVIQEIHIDRDLRIFRELNNVFSELRDKLEKRVVNYNERLNSNFREINVGLRCLKSFGLSPVDLRLLCSAVYMASRSDQPVGLLTNDGGLLNAITAYNDTIEGLSDRYFTQEVKKIHGYTFLSERSKMLVQQKFVA